MAGGDGQPPIRPIADAAKAGFNMLLGRHPTNGSSSNVVMIHCLIIGIPLKSLENG